TATRSAPSRHRAIQRRRVFRTARNARAAVAGHGRAGTPSVSRHPSGRRRFPSLAPRELPRCVGPPRRRHRASAPVRADVPDDRRRRAHRGRGRSARAAHRARSRAHERVRPRERAAGTLRAVTDGAREWAKRLGTKEAFAPASLLLAAAKKLVIATGIANIWARDPVAMANGARTLIDAYPDHFLLGLGVSHAPTVKTRGQSYARPLEYMRHYLDAMDAAPYVGPKVDVPRVLAALGPQMLRLSVERT